MPPIPITLHSSPSHTSPTKRIIALSTPVYLPSHQASKPHPRHKRKPMLYYTESSHAAPTIPAPETRPAGPSPTPSSSGSSTSQPAISHRTKPRPRPPTSELSGVTLVPQLKPIVDRCYLPGHPAAAPAPPVSSGKSGATTPLLPNRRVLPYNPLVDLGNDRSAVPSPKEILRMQRMEEQKIEAKKLSAAAARAAIANKRKRGNGKSRGGSRSRGGNGVATRSASPSNPNSPNLSKLPDPKREVLPSISTQPASPVDMATTASAPASSNAAPAVPSRMGLKRTRSTGPLSISAATANAIGTASFGAGSPLKAVHGPNDGETEDVAPEDQRVVKRLKAAAAPSEIPTRSTRRKTHSPPSLHTSLLPDSATPKAELGAIGVRTTPRSLSVSGEAGGSGGANTSTAMRRVASAHVPSVRSRLGSAGPLDAAARERSKRETNLPRALRDYDTRAGVY